MFYTEITKTLFDLRHALYFEERRNFFLQEKNIDISQTLSILEGVLARAHTTPCSDTKKTIPIFLKIYHNSDFNEPISSHFKKLETLYLKSIEK